MSQSAEEKREIIEVVAEPMEEEGAAGLGGETVRRLRRGLRPVLSGLIIDAVDFTTFHPIVGFPCGLVAGYVLATHLHFKLGHRLLAALACALYCMLPPTRFFPMATMIGLLANMRDPRKPSQG